MMRYLLDVNVLIALFDQSHVNHEAAHDWFAKLGSRAWATCPLTENGFVRIVSHSRYPSVDVRPAEAVDHLRAFTRNQPDHEFWPDEVSLTDGDLFDPAFLVSSRQVTDAYLLGLACKHGGKLATFDRHLEPRCVRGQQGEMIEILQG